MPGQRKTQNRELKVSLKLEKRGHAHLERRALPEEALFLGVADEDDERIEAVKDLHLLRLAAVLYTREVRSSGGKDETRSGL